MDIATIGVIRDSPSTEHQHVNLAFQGATSSTGNFRHGGWSEAMVAQEPRLTPSAGRGTYLKVFSEANSVHEPWSGTSTSGLQRHHEVLEGFRRQNSGPFPAVVRQTCGDRS